MIEPLGPGDADAAAALVAAGLGRPWTAADVETERARLGAIALAARTDGALVGVALAWAVAGELEVNVVAVDVAQRRLGIARALVARMIADARAAGATVGFLEVRADNAPAIALYRAAGFVEDGRRRGYYADGTDAVLMRANL